MKAQETCMCITIPPFFLIVGSFWKIPHILGDWVRNIPFISSRNKRPKIPPFPGKWKCACGPPCTYDWGRGGGGLDWNFTILAMAMELPHVSILPPLALVHLSGGGGQVWNFIILANLKVNFQTVFQRQGRRSILPIGGGGGVCKS